MAVGPREALEVVELQRAGVDASAAPFVGEGAAPAVASVDGTLDRVGDVPRGLPKARGARRARRSAIRLPSNGEAFLLDCLDQGVERGFEHGSQVAVGDAVPKQILCLLELFSKGPAGGELNLVCIFREWLNGRLVLNPPRRSRRKSRSSVRGRHRERE